MPRMSRSPISPSCCGARNLRRLRNRTDIYDKLGDFLKLPAGELAKLAEQQRKHELKKRIEDPPTPLFKKARDLILGKCKADKRKELSAIFEKQSFGELERLVTQTLVDVIKAIAKEELGNEAWLRLVSRICGQSAKSIRSSILQLLDAEVLSIAIERSLFFLNPLIVSWDIDLGSFALEINVDRQITPTPAKKFEFAEREVMQPAEEPGLKAFLKDSTISGDATEDENPGFLETTSGLINVGRAGRRHSITIANCKISAIRCISGTSSGLVRPHRLPFGFSFSRRGRFRGAQQPCRPRNIPIPLLTMAAAFQFPIDPW